MKQKNTWTGFELVVVSVCMYLAAIFLIPYALSALMEDAMISNEGYSNYVNISGIVSNIVIIIFMLVIMKNNNLLHFSGSELIKKKLLITLGLFICFIEMELFASCTIGSWFNAGRAVTNQQSALMSGNILICMINVLILVPLAEEVFFRGTLYGGLRQKCGQGVSIIITSFFFALAHFQGWLFLIMFIFGVIQCFIYEFTRELIYPVLFHFINNLISTLLGNGLIRLYVFESDIGNWIAFFVFFSFLIFFIYYCLRRLKE